MHFFQRGPEGLHQSGLDAGEQKCHLRFPSNGCTANTANTANTAKAANITANTVYKHCKYYKDKLLFNFITYSKAHYRTCRF